MARRLPDTEYQGTYGLQDMFVITKDRRDAPTGLALGPEPVLTA